MRLGFYGGAGTVTGSRFLLECHAGRVLVDCGLFQGLKALRLLNWQPTPFDLRSIDAIVLTHAHIDHSGYLPRLVKAGYRGPIYATPGTTDLARILLRDAATLQEEDAEYANRKGFSKHHPALPLFTLEDAERALKQFRSQQAEVPFEAGGMSVRFHRAGHILGSSFVEVLAPADANTETRIVFSGDLGRYDAPIHADPRPLPDCDTLLLESTYGDQLHSDIPFQKQLRKPFHETLSRGGTILIPAFAVARAQLVIILLKQLMEEGQLPRVPIHLDSPMAIEVSEAYERHLPSNDLEIERRDLFPKGVRFHRTREQSQELNELPGPRIIIAGSGMMTGGRVLHHMSRLLPDAKNLLVLVGYQADGTRGRALLEGAKSVRIHGREVAVKSAVLDVHGLSAHADAADLDRWLHSGHSLPKTVFLTHGEPPALRELAKRLTDGALKVMIPQLNDEYQSDGKAPWELYQPWRSASHARRTPDV
ncbi:MAG TPA: MBL fold metallo-hydrolase [Dehalococcoidia bacterium]|nr:MBL fold metallo-hydrolase [Dehalococcoidia bacterium]